MIFELDAFHDLSNSPQIEENKKKEHQEEQENREESYS